MRVLKRWQKASPAFSPGLAVVDANHLVKPVDQNRTVSKLCVPDWCVPVTLRKDDPPFLTSILVEPMLQADARVSSGAATIPFAGAAVGEAPSVLAGIVRLSGARTSACQDNRPVLICFSFSSLVFRKLWPARLEQLEFVCHPIPSYASPGSSSSLTRITADSQSLRSIPSSNPYLTHQPTLTIRQKRPPRSRRQPRVPRVLRRPRRLPSSS